MRAPASLLHRTATIAAGPSETTSSSPATMKAPEEQTAPTMAVDSNMVMILASLLSALVCVLGLALVSRCTCRRRRRSSSSDHSSPPPKGLKKTIDALPTVFFAAATPTGSSSPESATTGCCSSSECAICLSEFAEGESLHVLPLCGHGFHVACVDVWLRTRATCPSCRAAIIVAVEPAKPAPTQTVVVVVAGDGGSRCGRCGEVAAPSAGGGDATPTFLP